MREYEKQPGKTSFLGLEHCGIGISDQLLVYPAVGNRKIIGLKGREIGLKNAHRLFYNPNRELGLPNLGRDPFGHLISLRKDSRGGEERFYGIKSLCEDPFKINGVYSYDSLLCHGDTVSIGLNKLTFLQKKMVSSNRNIFEVKNFETISKSSLKTFIEGETGTGKTYLAKDIHKNSDQKGEFVHLNLSSFSAGVLESELFGHKKGSFTGAFYDRKGGLVQSHKGTLFLDEIDSLTPDIQTKLLLFFDQGLVRPVGGTREERVEAKIIISSGRNLSRLVRAGTFRRDLYYRITSGHRIHLKPLRQRREKINHILQGFEADHGIFISPELKKFYRDFDWPGNLRQIYSHLELKRDLSSGKYWIKDECDLELEMGHFDADTDNEILPLRHMKRHYVGSVFHKTQCSFSKTAQILKVSPNTVKNILKRVPRPSD